jgi:hypothetical protein
MIAPFPNIIICIAIDTTNAECRWTMPCVTGKLPAVAFASTSSIGAVHRHHLPPCFGVIIPNTVKLLSKMGVLRLEKIIL